MIFYGFSRNQLAMIEPLQIQVFKRDQVVGILFEREIMPKKP